jgi:hypothetical protein
LPIVAGAPSNGVQTPNIGTSQPMPQAHMRGLSIIRATPIAPNSAS